jgi:uncharacterized protein
VAGSPFVLSVSDLLGREASSRPVIVEAPVQWGIEHIVVAPDPPLRADLVLHPVSGGIAVTGSVSFTTRDVCFRCLAETTTDRTVSLGALFDGSGDEESYPLEGTLIDTEQLIRDEVLLSLPITHTCGEDCPGVVNSTESDLNNGSSGDEGDSRSPFAVLKDLLEPED